MVAQRDKVPLLATILAIDMISRKLIIILYHNLFRNKLNTLRPVIGRIDGSNRIRVIPDCLLINNKSLAQI